MLDAVFAMNELLFTPWKAMHGQVFGLDAHGNPRLIAECSGDGYIGKDQAQEIAEAICLLPQFVRLSREFALYRDSDVHRPENGHDAKEIKALISAVHALAEKAKNK